MGWGQRAMDEQGVAGMPPTQRGGRDEGNRGHAPFPAPEHTPFNWPQRTGDQAGGVAGSWPWESTQLDDPTDVAGVATNLA